MITSPFKNSLYAGAQSRHIQDVCDKAAFKKVPSLETFKAHMLIMEGPDYDR
jgi:hypothetical protein